jgi:hypothetical protein
MVVLLDRGDLYSRGHRLSRDISSCFRVQRAVDARAEMLIGGPIHTKTRLRRTPISLTAVPSSFRRSA